MTKREELDLFLEKSNDLITSKYILADIKIANLLKSIALSETLIALFKSCLQDFDMTSAKNRYLVKTPYLSGDKGEFVLPSSSKELLAFIFTLLVEMDSKTISIGDFLSRYFYENGSYTAGYDAFVNSMIKPFVNSVKMLMESVIEGKIQDPLDAVSDQEKRQAEVQKQRQERAEKHKELSKKSYAETINKIKENLLKDKQKVKESKLNEKAKYEANLVIDMLGNVIEETDKDAIDYAFTAYKYFVKCHKLLFAFKLSKMKKLIEELKNGLN